MCSEKKAPDQTNSKMASTVKTPDAAQGRYPLLDKWGSETIGHLLVKEPCPLVMCAIKIDLFEHAISSAQANSSSQGSVVTS